MDDDPYLKMIDDVWDKILLMYNTFRGKKQIIEFDVSKQKIYSYPADDYIRQLSERTQASTRQMFADISKRNQFLLFVRDNANQRLRSYVFDLPE